MTKMMAHGVTLVRRFHRTVNAKAKRQGWDHQTVYLMGLMHAMMLAAIDKGISLKGILRRLRAWDDGRTT